VFKICHTHLLTKSFHLLQYNFISFHELLFHSSHSFTISKLLMHPKVLQVLHPSNSTHFYMFCSPIYFLTKNISSTAPTDACVYPKNGRNSWQYFAGLHQNILLCRYTHLSLSTLNTALSCVTQIQLIDYTHMYLCVL
jgi:hypothetical protein